MIPYNSDMAMVGLMAQDILHRGAHPVFFDGAEYGGTLEQHWVAAWFRFLPETMVTHQVAIAVLLAATLLLVWQYSRRFLNERAAFLGALYLAVGPMFFFRRGLTSEGPYAPIFLIIAGALALLIRAELRGREGWPVVLEALALGLLLGLGWWTHPLTMVLGASLLVALALGHLGKSSLAWSSSCAAVGFLLGSLPWWVRNVHTGWASVGGADAQRATLEQVLHQTKVFVMAGVPVLLGAKTNNAAGEVFPGAAALAWALLLTLAVYGLKTSWMRRGTAVGVGTATLMPLFILCPAFALLSHRTNFVEPRLIFPFYFALAPLLGSFLTERSIPRLARTMLGITALALALGSHLAAEPVRAPPTALAAELRSEGVAAVYGSYWDTYNTTFVSQGSVVGTPFGRGEVVRRPQDKSFVDAQPSPAFVFREEPARGFAAFLEDRGFSSRRKVVGDLSIFSGLRPEALAILRRCYCVPSGLKAEGVHWQHVEGPQRLGRGATAAYRAEVSNDGRFAWAYGIFLSYSWLRTDGSVAVPSTARHDPSPKLQPGERQVFVVQVTAPQAAGSYTLKLDAVEEGIGWFSEYGSQAPTVQVSVD